MRIALWAPGPNGTRPIQRKNPPTIFRPTASGCHWLHWEHFFAHGLWSKLLWHPQRISTTDCCKGSCPHRWSSLIPFREGVSSAFFPKTLMQWMLFCHSISSTFCRTGMKPESPAILRMSLVPSWNIPNEVVAVGLVQEVGIWWDPARISPCCWVSWWYVFGPPPSLRRVLSQCLSQQVYLMMSDVFKFQGGTQNWASHQLFF